MRGRRAPPNNLLVCFPSRSHFTLMPKPIVCSPSRTQNSSKRNTPLFITNNKKPIHQKNQLCSEIGSEPTSPKVTCAGQIKIHRKNRNGHRPDPKNWIESLGLKKDVMSFLGVLRSMRFNMQCFGSLHGAVDCCSDEDEEEEDGGGEEEEEEVSGGRVFSKWFMVLEDKQEVLDHNHEDEEDEEHNQEKEEDEYEEEGVELPPKNALLLMRCRSTPAKREEKDKDKEDEEKLMLRSYAPDFFKLSTDIAKETWVVGGVDPLLARSRSWKR